MIVAPSIETVEDVASLWFPQIQSSQMILSNFVRHSDDAKSSLIPSSLDE